MDVSVSESFPVDLEEVVVRYDSVGRKTKIDLLLEGQGGKTKGCGERRRGWRLFEKKAENWLGDRDSNPDRLSQSQLSCR